MNQSSFIAGGLLAAFVVWLAANNRLSTYTGVLWGPTKAATPSGTPQASSGTGNTLIDSVVGKVLGVFGL